MIIAILEALIALPKIGQLVVMFCTNIAAWWVSRQQETTYHEIINAAALSARAKNQEDRVKALQMWRSVLSRPRLK